MKEDSYELPLRNFELMDPFGDLVEPRDKKVQPFRESLSDRIQF